MTLDKYYTPEIEEFFHGFEYEVWENSAYTNESWIKKIFQFRDNNVYKDTSFIIAEFEQRGDDIRVKYLDKEDIESLGFKYQKHNTYYKNLTDKILLRLEALENNILLIEYFINGNNTLNCIINIKNKSELKKLMKQLNIYDIR